MTAYASSQGQKQIASAQPMEGITVTGEAMRRVSPENAEFVIEIASSAPNAAQALRDNQTKFAQVAQALQALGVHAQDLQTISQNVMNLYAPVMQHAGYGMPQIGPAGFGVGMAGALQPDLQFGSYRSQSLVRVQIRDMARAGEALDAATRAGGVVTGTFQFRTSDEASARRAVLEAAGKDARSKAEALAAAAGKQIGEAISILEDVIASNGAFTAMRSTMPFAFGPGIPQIAGELEFYARVSASFRLH